MSDKITVVLPPISEDAISSSLRDLTEILEEHTGTDNVQGILGGRHGYGVEFKNDVFEMHPYYWGDCTCEYDDDVEKFYDNLFHEDHCYQTDLTNHLRAEGFKVTEGGWLDDEGIYDFDAEDKFHVRKSALARELSIKHGLDPEIGVYVHCTCSYETKARAWEEANTHGDNCRMDKPNFYHYASGLQVAWYKYIGRSMEVSKEVTITEWTNIFVDCVNSLNAEGELNQDV